MAKSQNGGNGNGGGSGTSNATELQFELLGAIRVDSFTANPPVVQPFGSTTLSWQVTLPTNLHTPVRLLVAGQQGAENATSGSVAATLTGDTEFGITAQGTLVSRVIGSLTVTVDQSQCKAFPPLPTGNLTALLKTQIDAQFTGSSQIALRGAGSVVTPVDGGITIAIPLHLNIPDWFDAEMDMAMQLGIAMASVGTLEVSATGVTVHVTWTWLQDLAGCTEFGQQIAQAFLTEIVNRQLVPEIFQQLDNTIQSFAGAAQQSDPQHRRFVLTSLSFTADSFTFTVCPEGSSHVVRPASPPATPATG